jgi:rubrerythrin
VEAEQQLVAGFVHVRRGAAYYKGALRTAPGRPAVWTCEHTHYSPMPAKLCAQGELYRRGQAGREVFELLHCVPCAAWHGADGQTWACPACGVPRQRLKVLVLERAPA